MKKQKYGNLLSELLNYVRPHKVVFSLSVIFDLLAIALNMTIPIFSGLSIDVLIGAGRVNFILLSEYLVIIGIIAIASSLFDWLGSHYMNILTYKTFSSEALK